MPDAAAAPAGLAYLLVESQGPWAGPGCARFVADATALAAAGHPVHLVLVDDGVTAAVDGALPALDEVARHGGLVAADGFALARRGIAPDALAVGVDVVEVDAVAALLLAPGVRVVWR